MATARIRAAAITMDPQAPGSVPAGSLFFDTSNSNSLAQKDTTNTNIQVAGVSSNDLMIKIMQNLSGTSIPVGKPVSKEPDGSIAAANADGPSGTQIYCGVALDAINNNSTGRVLLVGPNVAGVLTGLGFTPGQTVFLNENGGYTNNTGSFVGHSDSIIQIGIADCTAGNATATVTDLIMFPDVVVRP